jgi:hypothetical protein
MTTFQGLLALEQIDFTMADEALAEALIVFLLDEHILLEPRHLARGVAAVEGDDIGL